MLHLGINIREKESNYINKEFYLKAKPEGMPGLKEEDYARRKIAADYNFDLNMRYFEALDYDEFQRYLSEQCQKFGLTECTDLKELTGVRGVYMLVLDKYKQVYIGQTEDIRKRVLSHWNGRKSLERLIFGQVWNSVISIDCFGALDTTRVFFIKWEDYGGMFAFEEKIVAEFDGRYTLNRTGGGIGAAETYTDGKACALMAVVANKKEKDLVQFIDTDKLKAMVSPSNFSFFLRSHPDAQNRVNME